MRATRLFSRSLLAVVPILLGLATRAVAQVEEDPVTVPVRISLSATLVGNPGLGTGGSAGFWVNGYGNVVNTSYPTGVNFAVSAQLMPGKTYTMTLTATEVWYGYGLYITGPAGYRIFVNDVERYGLVYGGPGQVTVAPSVTIRVDAGEGAPAGEASSLRPGRLIWTAGLGNLKNGQPAGVIALRQSNITALSAADFQASALAYSPPSAEVQRYDGAGPNAGKYQIFANQCLAHVEPIGGGQEGFYLKFYSRYDVGTTISNGLWVITGSPYVEYMVQNTTPFAYGTSAKLRITKVGTLNSSGQSTTNTWRSELRQLGGQPGGTYVWDVIDWTTNGIDGSGNLITGDAWSRWTYTNSGLNEDIKVYTGAGTGQLASRVYNTYQSYAWGAELTQSIAGYGGSNPLTTSYAYHTNSGSGYWGSYSRLLHRIEPTGKWIRYAYYEDNGRLGRVSATYEPWNDAPSGPAAGDYANGLVTNFNYASDWAGASTRPNSITRSVGSTTIAKTTIGYVDTPVTESVVYGGTTYPVIRYLVQATTQSYYNASQHVTTVTRDYREDAGMDKLPNGEYEKTRGFLPGLPYDATAGDGSKQVWTYLRGERDPWFWGFLSLAEGSEWCIRQEQQGPSGPVAGLSTATSTVYSYTGNPVLTLQSIYASSGWVGTGAIRGYFLKGLVTEKLEAHSGDMFTNWIARNSTWAGGRLIATKDASGVDTQFTYDGKGRISTERIVPMTGQPQAGEQWIIHGYNGADQETSTKRTFNNTGGDAANDIVTEAFYDTAGRVTSTRAWGQSGWLTTSFTYNYGNYRTTLTTAPDGGTTISAVCLDGRPKSVTGTAQAPQYFSHWAQGDGRVRSQQRLAATTDGDGWTDTYADWLGRVSEEVRPTTTGHTKDRRLYNGSGQLSERQLFDQNWSALLAPTRYSYGSMGQLTREGMDVNENGSLEDVSLDRVTIYDRTFESLDGAWWRKTTTKALTNSANATDGVQTIVRERLTGRTASLQAETRTVDANGQTTTAKTLLDRANKTVTVETTVPGSSTPARTITKNGFLAQTVSSTGVTATFTYDVYGRLTKTQGRESVLEEKVYHPKSTLVKNLRNAILTPGIIGSEWQIFSYDSAGRLATRQTNNVGVWKTARYEYNLMGQVVHQWGDAATPVEYVYNSYGWRTNMRLYRNGSNWNAGTWSSAVSGATAETTTWACHNTTGLVTSKTDPANRTVSFTYNARNQPATRTWARGVVTTYAYEETAGYRTGELKLVSYSDSTPAASYVRNLGGAYTRHGLPNAIFDGAGGRVMAYRLNDLQVSTEHLDQPFYGTSAGGYRAITRNYDSLGRPSSITVGFGAGNEQNSYYTYDAATGRVQTIRGYRAGACDETLTYGYRAGSDLVSVVHKTGGFRRDIHHQAWRNAVDVVETKWNGSSRGRFTYDYDWLEQPSARKIESALATTLGYSSGLRDEYLYTPRGEMDWTIARNLADNATIPDRYRDWTFDAQGNRTNEAYTGGSRVFSPNNLNQYNSIAGVTHSYDHDGNLTSDGVWNYTWDGENRLKVASRVDLSQFLEFTYDYMGRRVRKVVRNVVFQLMSDRRYIYDGWNLVDEIDATQGGPAYVSVAGYTWGLDITGTIHGGGGVGGLLIFANPWGVYMPVYDTNGNVHGLLAAANGNLVAAYAYSASGEVIAEFGGAHAANNPFRFASKSYDSETKLYQYNHRYYSPSQGRFINRDPIAENGGLNLYAYCGNDPVGQWDYLGQSWLSDVFRKLDKLHRKHKHLVFKGATALLPRQWRRSGYNQLVEWDIKAEPYAKIIAAAIASYYTGGLAYGWMETATAGMATSSYGAAVQAISSAAAKHFVASATNSLILGTDFDAQGAFISGLASGFSTYTVNKLPTTISLKDKSIVGAFGSARSASYATQGIIMRGLVKGAASEISGKGFGDGLRGSIIGDFQSMAGETFKGMALRFPAEIDNPARKLGKSFAVSFGSRLSGAILKDEDISLRGIAAAAFPTAWNETFGFDFKERTMLDNGLILFGQTAVATFAATMEGKDSEDAFDNAGRTGLKRIAEGYAKIWWP